MQGRPLCLLAWLLLPLLFAAATQATPAAAADVVVHPAGAAPAVNRSLLRGIFGMRVRAWPDGTPVRVFVLEDEDPVHIEFCKAVLRIYPYQLRQNWDRLIYSGTGQPPVGVSNEKELLRRVAETPGAIGYVNRLDASAASAQKLKVLHVQE